MLPKIIAFANDDLSFSAYRVREFEKLGYVVKYCGNTAEVLQLFEKSEEVKPDMLVMDSFLAHGNEFAQSKTRGCITTGIAIYKRLRMSNPTLPIVIFTTDSQALAELVFFKDKYLKAVDERGIHSTEVILEAVTKLLPLK